MKGLGTLVNVLAVLAGSGLGMLIKTGLKRRFRDILMQACGIATIFLGISGALAGLLKVENGAVSTQNTMLLIFSLVLGGLAGEALNIEAGMEALGERLKRLVRDKSDSRFVDGFVTASLVICVGAMAIVGSIQDGLTGDHTLLFSKSLLDFVIVMVFAATFGLGVMFSALPLGILQGGITLAAALVAGFLSESLISDLSCVGSVLIFCVGLNVAFNAKIRVGNLLPALLVPVLWALF
ncbi:membrane protein [Oscillospiraceae bacterium]|uniref:DUF554 domain-containing protein n=1 Tax=Allofournierella sp. TaxID=1940256 RepID=UPI0015AD374D|nr:membrane protein [Oscillospiraceae bacterium]